MIRRTPTSISQIFSDKLTQIHTEIDDAIELIEVCRREFQQELSRIEKKMFTASVAEKKFLEEQAVTLYNNYKNALTVIEGYIKVIEEPLLH